MSRILFCSAVVAVLCAVYSYYVLFLDSQGAEKWTPVGVNLIRYYWSFSPFEYGAGDQMSGIFLPHALKYALEFSMVRWIFIKIVTFKLDVFVPIVGAKTGFYDSVWTEAMEQRGIQQIISFGAGFDSRSIRYKDIITAHNVSVFEVDLPNLQQAKKGIICQHFEWDDIPSYLTYVPCDLNEGSDKLCMEETPYNSNVATLFQMEGLLMYLQPKTVDKIFRFIQQTAGRNSIVVFDIYAATESVEDKMVRDYLEKRAENMTFTLESDDIIPFFEKYNFNTIDVVSGDAMIGLLPETVQKMYSVPPGFPLFIVKAEY